MATLHAPVEFGGHPAEFLCLNRKALSSDTIGVMDFIGQRLFQALLCAAFLAAGCGSPKPLAILAVSAPLSGELEAEGGGILRAASLAVSEFGAARDFPRTILVKAYDDQGTAQGAVAAAKKIVADPRVFAVIGDFTSDSSLAASKIYAPAGLLMITPSAANSVLTSQQDAPGWKWGKTIFRMPPTDLVQAASAARFAYSRLDLRSFYVVEDGSSYGMEFTQAFDVDFKKEGGKIQGFDEILPMSPDFSRLIHRLEISKPQGVFFGGFYPEAAHLLIALRRAKIKATFFSGGASKADELFKRAGPASDGAYFVISGVPVDFLPSADPFVARYKALFKATPRTYDVYAYEAAKIALKAFQKSGGVEKKTIEAIHDLRENGMIGQILFDDKGDDLNALVTIVRANYGKRKFEPAY